MMDSHAEHGEQEDNCDWDELMFYIEDYPTYRQVLEKSYDAFEVSEHSAEPGRVGGCPDDADVCVQGRPSCLIRFKQWLEFYSDIPGIVVHEEDE